MHYYGIDSEESYVKSTEDVLQELNITSTNIQHGDFLNTEDLAKLPNEADIILASHVAYYATNITDFVSDLIKKSKETTTLVFFHQSELSVISEFREDYMLDGTVSPQQEIKESLESRGFKVLEFLYPAIITFPGSWFVENLIRNGALLKAEPHYFPEMKLSRNLLEFIAHSPLERLEDRNELNDFVDIVANILKSQNDDLVFWDVMQIATKVENKNADKLKDSIEQNGVPSEVLGIESTLTKAPKMDLEKASQMSKVSIGRLSPIELACYEGNLEVAKKLESQSKLMRSFKGLIFASRNGHIEVIEWLLEKMAANNITINITSDEGHTALHMASYFNHPYIVKLLLASKIDVHKKDNIERTAIFLAGAKCNARVIEILWRHNQISDEKLNAREINQLLFLVSEYCSEDNPEIKNVLYLLREGHNELVFECWVEMSKIYEAYNTNECDWGPDCIKQLEGVSETEKCREAVDVDLFLYEVDRFLIKIKQTKEPYISEKAPPVMNVLNYKENEFWVYISHLTASDIRFESIEKLLDKMTNINLLSFIENIPLIEIDSEKQSIDAHKGGARTIRDYSKTKLDEVMKAVGDNLAGIMQVSEEKENYNHIVEVVNKFCSYASQYFDEDYMFKNDEGMSLSCNICYAKKTTDGYFFDSWE